MEYGIFLMFLNLGKLLLLDRHQVWRSHDPTSIRIFHFVDFIPHFWFVSFCTNSQRLPEVARGY